MSRSLRLRLIKLGVAVALVVNTRAAALLAAAALWPLVIVRSGSMFLAVSGLVALAGILVRAVAGARPEDGPGALLLWLAMTFLLSLAAAWRDAREP